MKMSCCVWCHAPVQVPLTFNEMTTKVVCSDKCQDEEELFCILWSNKMVEFRARQLKGKKPNEEIRPQDYV